MRKGAYNLPHLRVASRKSLLAMTQTKWVIAALCDLEPELSIDIVPIVTKGDKIVDVALSKVGGKGLFVSEIEEAILAHEVDFAVHSMKDVPAQLADGLMIAGVPKREDPRDAFISAQHLGFYELPHKAIVGTSSLRRIAQLQSIRPDIHIEPLRGNIDTRLQKLENQHLDAIILAAAGLHRLGWKNRITEYLATDICLPAIGQGILGIECRVEDAQMVSLLQRFTDANTLKCSLAERTLLQELQGSCQVPIAGYASVLENGKLTLQGFVGSVDGKKGIHAFAEGEDPIDLGCIVAADLFRQGAYEILREADEM